MVAMQLAHDEKEVKNMGIDIDIVIDFLESETISVTFSQKGLKYLSPKGNNGEEMIYLKNLNKAHRNPWPCQVVVETFNFLTTGKHNMPLDLSEFTVFQQEVFEAVNKIESGNIATYKEIAEILGKPGAAQAVGSAVAKNPVSYFIPTHRILPKAGIGICRSGSGYLREKLLIHEGHDISKLRGNYVCNRKECCLEISKFPF